MLVLMFLSFCTPDVPHYMMQLHSERHKYIHIDVTVTIMGAAVRTAAHSMKHEQLFYLVSTHATEMDPTCVLHHPIMRSACNDRLSQLDVASLSIAEFELNT